MNFEEAAACQRRMSFLISRNGSVVALIHLWENTNGLITNDVLWALEDLTNFKEKARKLRLFQNRPENEAFFINYFRQANLVKRALYDIEKILSQHGYDSSVEKIDENLAWVCWFIIAFEKARREFPLVPNIWRDKKHEEQSTPDRRRNLLTFKDPWKFFEDLVIVAGRFGVFSPDPEVHYEKWKRILAREMAEATSSAKANSLTAESAAESAAA
jgi:hypothetical protein